MIRRLAGVPGFFLSAALGIFSFPPFSFWPLALFALVPFLFAAGEASPRSAFRWGYLSGFAFFSGLLYWIGFNSGAPVPLAWTSCVAVIAILATVWAICAWAVSKTTARLGIIAATILFVVLYQFFEVFWGHGELGFPWAVWGLTQSAFVPALQFADIGDIYGLSLWVLLCNALLFLVLKSVRLKWTVPLLFLVILSVPLYGVLRMAGLKHGKSITVAAVQLNTPVDEKWQKSVEETLDDYLANSSAVVESGAALVVWPETATPIALRYKGWARYKIQDWCDLSRLSLITGATDYKNDPALGMLPYNSAFYFRAGIDQARRSSGASDDLLSSHKVHLVPFGERVPFQKILPLLGKIRLGQAEFLPADSITVFPQWRDLPPFATLICFEVLFPDVAANMVKHGAQFLTNITEDGWYGRSSEQSQHLELTRIRAVATRRSIIRAANLGYAAIILPSGATAAALDRDQSGVVFADVPVRTELTFAARTADYYVPFYTGLLLLTLLALFLFSRRFAN